VLRLRVRYRRPSDLVTDYDQQLVRGGLLVRIDPPAGLNPFDPVEVELVAAGGALLFAAEVLQVFPGVGVAVKIDASSVAELADGVAHARAHLDAPGDAPVHELVPTDAPPATGLTDPPPVDHVPPAPAPPAPEPEAAASTQDAAGKPAAASPVAKVQAATGAEKIQIALYGSREERALILRDLNKSLHVHVLRNAGLQADEIVAMAKMTNVGADFLDGIAARREWSERPDVAIALVRNPKTAITTAVRLVAHVSPAELRQLAKDTHTRAPIQQAARKRMAR
jgi:hypothetical protein